MNNEKKLRPEEVSLYRKTFLARVSNGATVEAADRAAIHACTLWERRGAFNDDTVEKDGEKPVRSPSAATTWRDEWDSLAEWLIEKYQTSYLDAGQIGQLMRKTSTGNISIEEFKNALDRSLDP